MTRVDIMRGIVHRPGRRGGKMATTITFLLAHRDAIVVVPTEQRRDELVRAAVPVKQIVVLPPIGNVRGYSGAFARCRWPM